MSQENVDVVRAAFEVMAQEHMESFRRGIEARLQFFAPSIQWTVRSDLPDAGVYRGHDGLRQLVGRFGEVLADQWIEPQEFIDAGRDSVVVPLHWGGRGKLSRVEVAERQGETWVFTVENEKITRVREYRHKAEALEAAGLRA